jgi:hypothetical protein
MPLTPFSYLCWEAATTQYNWGYLDNWEDIDIRTFWLFMLWRLQCHSSVDQLSEEVAQQSD